MVKLHTTNQSISVNFLALDSHLVSPSLQTVNDSFVVSYPQLIFQDMGNMFLYLITYEADGFMVPRPQEMTLKHQILQNL